MRWPLAIRSTACLVAVVAVPRLWAQTASIGGLVEDPTHASIVGAAIRLRNEATGTQRKTSSNGGGAFQIEGLAPGLYTATAQASGFTTVTLDAFLLAVGQNAKLDFHLSVGQRQDRVRVTDTDLTIDNSDASVSTVVDRNFVQNVPLNGRSMQPLIALSPGIAVVPSSGGVGFSGEITVNGQRTEANYFTVDGVSANTGLFPDNEIHGFGYSGNVPSETIAGTTQSMVSIDALQEFRVSTSTYSAEYGRTPGGQFAFSTRSGTNAVHGSLFDYIRNDVFDANAWFNKYTGQAKSQERQNDFGGTFGGPVWLPKIYTGRDRTFFFASYEGLRLRTPVAAIPIMVPDLQLRKDAAPSLRAILNAAPAQGLISDGLNDGLAIYNLAYAAPSNVDSGGIRLDHRVNGSTQAFARYSRTASSGYLYDPTGFKESRSIDTGSSTVGLTYTLGAFATDEFRGNLTWADIAYTRSEMLLDGATPFDIGTLPGANGGSLSAARIFLSFGATADIQSMHADAAQHQINLVDSLTWQVHTHTFKTGIDWRRIGSTVRPITALEVVNLASRASVVSGIADTISNLPKSQATPRPVYDNYSLYVQDDWRVSRRLSASLGLRWEINPSPTDAGGQMPFTVDQLSNIATLAVAPQGTPLWKTQLDALAPRIGFAYQARSDPGRQTVVRAGFGNFFDTGNGGAADGYRGIGLNAIRVYAKTAFPLTSSQLALSAPSTAVPYAMPVYGFDPHLRLPRSLEWNVSLEQGLGQSQTLTIGYVASQGHKLLAQRQYQPFNDYGNRNFAPNVGLLAYFNGAASRYNSLQVKYQRGLSKGLQVVASYTWSRSTDLASSNFVVYQLQKASSDFDIRHNVQTAITYQIPGPLGGGMLGKALRHWSADTRFGARTALPFSIYGSQQQIDMFQGEVFYSADVVRDQPLYLYGPNYPGGRAVNFKAFSSATTGTQGDAPRNLVRGFAAIQDDLAIQRVFDFTKDLCLLFRAEAFNVTNHPSFGTVENRLYRGPQQFGRAIGTLDTQLGGLDSLYQAGAARSLQFALKVQF